MHDTYVTVVGNIVTRPEYRQVDRVGASVLHFRIGSTARRFDKQTGGWVDGNSLFVNVSCWRSLGENAQRSLFMGDPVVVTGRLYTREYEVEGGGRRVSYELEATAVGHNLARGTSTFRRVRTTPPVEADEPHRDPAPGSDPHEPPVQEPDDLDPADIEFERLLQPVGALAD